MKIFICLLALLTTTLAKPETFSGSNSIDQGDGYRYNEPQPAEQPESALRPEDQGQTVRIIKTEKQPPQVKTLKIIHEHGPELIPVRVVHQLPPPPPIIKHVQILRKFPPPPPEIHEIRVVHQPPAPPPIVKTIVHQAPLPVPVPAPVPVYGPPPPPVFGPPPLPVYGPPPAPVYGPPPAPIYGPPSYAPGSPYGSVEVLSSSDEIPPPHITAHSASPLYGAPESASVISSSDPSAVLTAPAPGPALTYGAPASTVAETSPVGAVAHLPLHEAHHEADGLQSYLNDAHLGSELKLVKK